MDQENKSIDEIHKLLVYKTYIKSKDKIFKKRQQLEKKKRKYFEKVFEISQRTGIKILEGELQQNSLLKLNSKFNFYSIPGERIIWK